MWTHRLMLACLLGCCLVMARPALAAQGDGREAPQKGDKATLTVTVVHAHNAKAGVDPKLQPLSEYLLKSFSRYKGFNQVGAHSATISTAGKTSTKLPDGKTLTLAFKGVSKGFVKVYLELDGLKTTVDVRDGGIFFQAGRVYKGGILVLAIGAKTGTTSSIGGVDTTGP